MPVSDQLRIDTPEQVSLELPIAGLGSRFLALAIDTLLQGAVAAGVILGAGLTIAGTARAGLGGAALVGLALLVFFVFCLYWGYFAAFEIFWKGQTPGKRLVGIRVIKDSGRAIDPSASLIRNLLRIIDFLPGMYGVGVVTMFVSAQSQRLGDLAAGTVVIHDHGLSDGAFTVEAVVGSATTAATAGVPPFVPLTDAEIVLIETYLARRFELGPEAQINSAERIVARVKSSTGLTPSRDQSRDEFLEVVARQARDSGRYS